MFRYLERIENTARLIDAGARIALTHPDSAEDEWRSIITTAGVVEEFQAKHESVEAGKVVDFLLRDKNNHSSVIAAMDAARNNARMVRTALTRETWEATNEGWITLNELLRRQVSDRELTQVLRTIRQQAALVRAAMHGTMLRNDIYNFCRIGTFLERADNTARILDVKYYVLLPSISLVGSKLDNVQWEMILRSVSAQRSYRWLNSGDVNPRGIVDFLLLDERMPRSLVFCVAKIANNLEFLHHTYGQLHPCSEAADALLQRLNENTIDQIFDFGLHEFIVEFIASNAALARQIEQDYRFFG